MAKNDVEEVTEKALRRGGILAKLYFDMHAAAESDLQAVMADLINDKLLKANGVVYCFGSIDETIKNGDLYTTSAIVTTLVDSLENLANVVFTFAPVAIEVIKPEGQYILKQSELQNMLIALSSISVNYSEYIFKRVLKAEDYEKIKGDMKAREELGKKIMEKKDKTG